MLATAAIQAQPSTATAQRVALVIGNDRYAHVDPLINSGRDAQLIARTLQQQGFTLVRGRPLHDLSTADFRQALEEFRSQLINGAVGVFYYAGHGVQSRNVNYLVPVDARVERPEDIPRALLDARLVLQSLERSGARLAIAIFDACRDNPFAGRGGELRDGPTGLADMNVTSSKSMLISYATSPGSAASDGTAGSNSPFALALADSISKPGLSLLDTFNTAAVQVARATFQRQKPWISASAIDADFQFSGAGSGNLAGSNDRDITLWREVSASRDAADFQAYLRQYPSGVYAALARSRIESLGSAEQRQRMDFARSLGANIADKMVELDQVQTTVMGRNMTVRALAKVGEAERARSLAREVYQRVRAVGGPNFPRHGIALVHEALWQSGELALAEPALQWLRQRSEADVPADKRQDCLAQATARLSLLVALGQMKRTADLQREVRTIVSTLSTVTDHLVYSVCTDTLRTALRAWAETAEMSQVDDILDLLPTNEMRHAIAQDFFRVRQRHGLGIQRSLVERELRRALDAATDVPGQSTTATGTAVSRSAVREGRGSIYASAAAFHMAIGDRDMATQLLRAADESFTRCDQAAAQARARNEREPNCGRIAYALPLAAIEGPDAALAWMRKHVPQMQIAVGGSSYIARIVQEAAPRSDHASLQRLANVGLKLMEDAKAENTIASILGDSFSMRDEIYLRTVAGDAARARRLVEQARQEREDMRKRYGLNTVSDDSSAITDGEKSLAESDIRIRVYDAALAHANSGPDDDAKRQRQVDLVRKVAEQGDYRAAERFASQIPTAAWRVTALGALVDAMFRNPGQ